MQNTMSIRSIAKLSWFGSVGDMKISSSEEAYGTAVPNGVIFNGSHFENNDKNPARFTRYRKDSKEDRYVLSFL